jgi:uncharacterized protein involved in exopolysaccharide biosynthesis/LysM repeat protein
MDINQLIQILRRNIWFLILIPLALMVVVYLVTRDTPKSYAADTVVYTGIASGYSFDSQARANMDYFGTNMQFDNLINLIKDRSTMEHTAIRLLAQHLCLESANPQYISDLHYNNLQVLVPQEVKDLVVKYNKTGAERDRLKEMKELQKEINRLEKEVKEKRKQAFRRNTEPENQHDSVKEEEVDFTDVETNQEVEGIRENGSLYHIVNYGESVSSIASIYGVHPGKLVDLNKIYDGVVYVGDRLLINRGEETTGETTPLFYAVKPDDNLFSIAQRNGVTMSNLESWNDIGPNTLIEPGRTLIVGYAGGTVDDYYSDEYGSNLIQDIDITSIAKVEKDPIVPPGVDPNDYWKTVENLTAYYNSSRVNFISELLQYSHPHYSYGALGATSVYRIQGSDLIKISYSSNDPGICQQTLKIMTEVFIGDYKALRITQNNPIVKYFEEAVKLASRDLEKAESRLLQFKTKNGIINYYEESKAIAIKKEELIQKTTAQTQVIFGARATLNSIESRLSKKDSIFLKRDKITNKRKELSRVSAKITINEVSQDYDPNTTRNVKRLERERDRIKDELKLLVDEMHLYSRTVEGIPIKSLLDEWLKQTILYEEAKASMKILDESLDDFHKRYDLYAPWGAKITKLEREIKVAEQEYLDMLRSLNEARMRQQNLEMATNIKVVSAPVFPLTVSGSKNKLLILAAGLIGFIMVIFIIVLLEYFDSSSKRPDVIKKSTGLPFAGAYPSAKLRDPNIDVKKSSDRMIEMVAQNLKLSLSYTSTRVHEKPYFILIFSTQGKTGKSTVGNHLIEKLRSFGDKVLFMNYTYDDEDLEIGDSNYNINYKIDNKFFELKHVRDLLQYSSSLRSENYEYDYVFIEIPSVIHNSYPLDLMSTMDASLLITRASHNWKKADEQALEVMNKVLPDKPLVVLNDVDTFVISEVLHDAPTTGNTFRNRMRKIFMAPTKMRIKFDKD